MRIFALRACLKNGATMFIFLILGRLRRMTRIWLARRLIPARLSARVSPTVGTVAVFVHRNGACTTSVERWAVLRRWPLVIRTRFEPRTTRVPSASTGRRGRRIAIFRLQRNRLLGILRLLPCVPSTVALANEAAAEAIVTWDPLATLLLLCMDLMTKHDICHYTIGK